MNETNKVIGSAGIPIQVWEKSLAFYFYFLTAYFLIRVFERCPLHQALYPLVICHSSLFI